MVSFFVTLTYANENLLWADDEPCLNKRDLQLHFKRLRKRLEPKTIKYYAVGEYGDSGGRPHYHYLLFYRGNYDRFKLMQYIKEAWTLGIVQVLPVHGAQGYVTKYILKFDVRDHLVKPFSMISHGIGIDYLSSGMIKYHQDNLINYCVKPGGYKVKMPRYYQDRIFTMYQRLLMKKRADLRRIEINQKFFATAELLSDLRYNVFASKINSYQMRLYNSIKLYRQKKKL